MRSCLTVILFTLLLIGAIVGVGALAMGQVHNGLCTGQPLRVLVGLGGGGLASVVILLILLRLVNLELLEKSLSGAQITIISLSVAVIGIGIAAFFASRSAHSSCPHIAEAADGLPAVCQGIGLASANANGTPRANIDILQTQSEFISAFQNEISNQFNDVSADHLIVLGSDGETIPWTQDARQEWTPQEMSQVSLAVCADLAKQVRLETCKYGGGISINRYREEVPVRLMQAQTGQMLVSAVLTADPPPCQPMGLQELGKLRAHVQYADLKAWVSKILAGEPAPGITPSPTNTPAPPTATLTPTDTLSPSPTPEITGKVKTGARVRSEPSTAASTIDGLTKGTKVVILGVSKDGAWLQVLTPKGQTGWIYAQLLKLTIPIDQIPQIP